jgi:hypothetical protein
VITASPTPRTRIEEAKARFTIPVLWRMFNLRGDPGSPCRSPFREDRSPSFSVFNEGRRWIDHATAERGDAVDFLAKIKGVSNPEAFIELLKMVDETAPLPVSSPHHSAVGTEPRRGPIKLDGIEPCSQAICAKSQSFALSLSMVSGWRRSGSFCLPILTRTRGAASSSPMTPGRALFTGGLMANASSIARLGMERKRGQSHATGRVQKPIGRSGLRRPVISRR